jgi:hypothetical protein
MSAFFYVVPFCAGRGLETGLRPVQVVLPNIDTRVEKLAQNPPQRPKFIPNGSAHAVVATTVEVAVLYLEKVFDPTVDI